MASESINPNSILENIEIDYVAEKIDFKDFEEFSNSASASASGLAKKKQRKKMISVDELKKISSRTDVVDKVDATAADPKLLVYLKSYRNTVPVPRHWSQKKKFLQGKRVIEKQPYQLPDYVAATGIEKIRETYIEKGESAVLNPEMNIDYQIFYDAFYVNQTKPKLTTYGDLYYQGKEFEETKPVGMLSRELKEALDMPPDGVPPPWLTNMQRHGSERWGDLVD
ncbi:Splicing factor 3b subunit [Thalictrum thalictroides]|uniref:Splicing factor 3b subunit n=1 Tax=Thalictrum thalictroides TaxID=46969 RepID=A0A7J6XB75_THATH|nr:Splicing factor 3b subunit [Thalictrum thalictroides]